MNKSKKIQFILLDTYISSIKRSVGTDIFRSTYALVNGKKEDVTKNGSYSCAVFVSSILLMFGLIKKRHATVESTVADMRKSGWKEIKRPKVGAILIWRPWVKSSNWHIGFYVGNNKAISNHWLKKVPASHDFVYGRRNGKPNRPMESIWWHKSLEK
ncbi:MAG: hypothetical protein WD712_02715 [Candidatus Spechtbacterales bacterium]